MSEAKEIKVEVSIKVGEGRGYESPWAFVEVKKLLNLNTDSSKRKIIDDVEDIVDRASREIADNLHHSSALTDGEVAKAASKKLPGDEF